MQQTLSIKTDHRYKQLDSLRGLAALTVFIGHAIGTVVNLVFLNKLTTTPISIFYNGYAAVMFFFVLSGFVLSLPFVNTDKPLSLAAFYTKRIFRIYPAFIAAILLALIFKQLVYDKSAMAGSIIWYKQYWAWDLDKTNLKEILRTFLLIAPDVNTKLIDPPIWSLVVEMKMSLLLPFFILVVSRSKAIVNVGLFFVLSYIAYRYTNMQVSVFYLGVLLAKYKGELIDRVKNWSAFVKVITLLVGLLLYNAGLEFLNLHSTPYYVVFSNYLPATGSCIIITLVLASNRLNTFLERKLLVFFGTISYSFYLTHFPVLIMVLSVMVNRVSLDFAVGLAFLLTLAISYLMAIFIERPFQRLASRLVKKHAMLNSLDIKRLRPLKSAPEV